MTDLENAVRKVFTLEFVIPKKNGEGTSSIAIFRPSNLNTSMLSRSTSASKVSAALMKSSSMMGLAKFADTSYSTFYPDG